MSKHSKKAILAVLSALVLCLMIGTIFAVNTAAQETAKNNELLARYDTSHDCIINIADVSATLNHLSKPDAATNTLRYDSNRDGQNGIADVTALLNFLSTNTEEITATLHAITYKNNANDAAVPQSTFYAEHIGVEDLPDLSENGYIFKGWATSPVASDAELMDDIPMGSSTNYTLYAQWELIEYTITYNKNTVPVHNNPTTYTVKDEILLSDPEWSGLKFLNWVEESGKIISYTDSMGNHYTKIPAGTTENLVLNAQWTTYENLVIPADNETLASVYDPTEERFYFVYDLGIIANVPLDPIFENYTKTTSANKIMSISQSVTLQTERVTEIAKKMAESVTSSTEWTEGSSIVKGDSTTADFNMSIGVEGGAKDIFKVALNTEFGLSATVSQELSHESARGGSTGREEENAKEISSTVAYCEDLSTTSECSIEIPGSMPNGTYAYVHAGSIRVFAIVTYDPIEERYYIDTYSILDNMHDILLYYANEYDMYKAPCGGLSFDIPVEKIKQSIESSYYVQYDANGGEGSMPLSVLPCNTEQALLKNQFTLTGYEFTGWELKSQDNVKIYTDCEAVNNLAAGGQTITLKALWTACKYTVKLNANQGTAEPTEQTVTYSNPYGTLPIPKRTGYTFGGWTLNGTLISEDTIVDTPSNHELVATWIPNVYTVYFDPNGGNVSPSSKTVTFGSAYASLPTPTKTGYTFNGWKQNNSPISKDSIVTEASDHTLVADWSPNVYKIIYNANGGTGEMKFTEHTVMIQTPLRANAFSRVGYVFKGWSTDPNANSLEVDFPDGVSVNFVTNQKEIVLYAVWARIVGRTYWVDNFHVSKNDDSSNYHVYWNHNTRDDFDVDYFIQNGYKLKISVSYYAKHLGNDGYIINRVWIDGWNYTYTYQPKFKNSLDVQWNTTLNAANNTISIDFTSGKFWTWDCTSYDVENLVIVFEFYQP